MNEPRPENGSYEAHALTCDADDLWGQVKRTVNGRPLPDAQIAMIVDTVSTLLDLQPCDRLLDLCCGNGALSHHWFGQCAAGLGIDASPRLIEIASARFATRESDRFVVAEALAYLRRDSRPSNFTKAVCYGSLQYFSRERAAELLCALRTGFADIGRVVIGNIPDRERAPLFFAADRVDEAVLDSPLEPIGVWYSMREFSTMARQCGWNCATSLMPEGFHAAHYRFDALLSPRGLNT